MIARATDAFICMKGEDYEIDWTIQTSDTNTTAIDITGWTFDFYLKRNASDADPVLISPTSSIVTAASGLAKTVFTAATTLLLEGDYVYSFWRTNAGALTCLSSGFFGVVDTTKN